MQLSIENKRKLHRFLKILNIYPNFYFNFSHNGWKTALTDNKFSQAIDSAFMWDGTKERFDFWVLVDHLWRQTCQKINANTSLNLRTNIQQLQECRNRAAKQILWANI